MDRDSKNDSIKISKFTFWATLNSVVLLYIYVNYLAYYFGYTGYIINYEFFVPKIALIVFLIALPTFVGRNKINSAYTISFFIYLLVYNSIIFYFILVSSYPFSTNFLIAVMFCTCMSFLFYTSRLRFKLPILKINIVNFHKITDALFIVAFIIIAIQLYKYRDKLEISTTFGQSLYELRSSFSKIEQTRFSAYSIVFLGSFLLPFLLTISIFYKKWSYIIFSTIICVALYASTAQKIYILYPVIYLFLYFFLNKIDLRRFPDIAMKITFWASITLYLTGFNILSSIYFYRIIGNSGQLTYQYFDFFNKNDNTYYTTINILRKFLKYPFGNMEVGQVIGYHYNKAITNSNANFWATDGFAALDWAGVVIITIILGLLLILINSVTYKLDKKFVLLCLIPFIVYLTNASLFTTLLSGGGLLFLITFYFLNMSPPKPLMRR